MIFGSINTNNEVVLRLFIRGAGAVTGVLTEIEAVIDTGFDEHLSLPTELIATLELPYLEDQVILFANGSIETCAVHLAVILWDGAERKVLVQSGMGTPLIGMAMLRGHDVVMHVEPGGAFSITKFPL